MNLLIATSAVERLGRRLAAIDPTLRLLQFDHHGDVHLDGVRCAEFACAPDVAWLSLDVFVEQHFLRFASILERSPGLQWVHTVHAGLDLPLYATLLEQGIRLSNSHAHAPALAEYVMANVMAVFQSHERQCQLQRAGAWQSLGFREIALSRWLIIGLGHAGSEIADRAKALGAHVTGVRRSRSSHRSVDCMLPPDQIPRVLPYADVVVLCCPLTAATRDMVDAAFVAAMRSGSVLVNIARGALIDDQALIEGLGRGQPGFAVLDVTRVEPLPATSAFWVHPQVRLTAHSAYSGNRTTGRGDDLFLENLRRYCAGSALLNEIEEL
jgi:phosphoglycerate dehydrogenase-like enzyme